MFVVLCLPAVVTIFLKLDRLAVDTVKGLSRRIAALIVKIFLPFASYLASFLPAMITFLLG